MSVYWPFIPFSSAFYFLRLCVALLLINSFTYLLTYFGVTLLAVREQGLIRTGNPLDYAGAGWNPVDCVTCKARLVAKTAGLRGNDTDATMTSTSTSTTSTSNCTVLYTAMQPDDRRHTCHATETRASALTLMRPSRCTAIIRARQSADPVAIRPRHSDLRQTVNDDTAAARRQADDLLPRRP